MPTNIPANSIFVSYSFTDTNAAALSRDVRDVASQLRWITIADGHSINPGHNFAEAIASYLRENIVCLVAIFTRDEAVKPNMMLEIGIALGAGKGVILVSESIEFVPAMLRAHDVIKIDRDNLDWKSLFQRKLEQKLWHVYRNPDELLFPEKIATRYLAEEMDLLKDPKLVQTAIASIEDADLFKAKGILENLIQNQPENLDAYFLLGDTYHLIGCSTKDPTEKNAVFSKQLQIANEALEVNPRHILCLSIKSTAEISLGLLSDALSTIESLREIAPQFTIALYNLSCIYSLKGDKSRTLKYLEKAIVGNAVWRRLAKGDPDFAYLWSDADWISLVYGQSST